MRTGIWRYGGRWDLWSEEGMWEGERADIPACILLYAIEVVSKGGHGWKRE
jgi:hypothetical protein